MPRNQPTSIVLDDKLKDELRAIADARKWTVAATIRNALNEWVSFYKAFEVKAKKKK